MTISATKPATDPRWSTDGGTRTEPLEAVKDTGWVGTEKPGAQVFNWINGLMYDWQQYLEDATDEIDATKLNLTGGTMTGTIVSSAATFARPSVTLNGQIGSSSNVFANLYAAHLHADQLTPSGTSLTLNLTQVLPDATGRDLGSTTARWDAFLEAATVYGSLLPSATGKDIGSTGARFDAFLEAVTVYDTLLPSATGKDLGSSGARWDAFIEDLYVAGVVTADLVPNSSLALGSAAKPWTAHLDGVTLYDAPAKNTAQTNKLTAINCAKAWASISMSGGAVLAYDGYNVTSVTITGERVRVTFADGFADANYAAVCENVVNAGGVGLLVAKRSRTASLYEVDFLDATFTEIAIASTGVFTFSIAFFGRQ